MKKMVARKINLNKNCSIVIGHSDMPKKLAITSISDEISLFEEGVGLKTRSEIASKIFYRWFQKLFFTSISKTKLIYPVTWCITNLLFQFQSQYQSLIHWVGDNFWEWPWLKRKTFQKKAAKVLWHFIWTWILIMVT